MPSTRGIERWGLWAAAYKSWVSSKALTRQDWLAFVRHNIELFLLLLPVSVPWGYIVAAATASDPGLRWLIGGLVTAIIYSGLLLMFVRSFVNAVTADTLLAHVVFISQAIITRRHKGVPVKYQKIIVRGAVLNGSAVAALRAFVRFDPTCQLEIGDKVLFFRIGQDWVLLPPRQLYAFHLRNNEQASLFAKKAKNSALFRLSDSSGPLNKIWRIVEK